ncbi:MAG TPA: hypothetical protein VJU17_03105, partial [Gemmatimonadales bacterium]|nr:hypothetical protein [Gemmatimonadales bacterium]
MTKSGGNRGSALAVDLRRARAAQRRMEESARPRLSGPPNKPAPTIACGQRDPLDCVREWFAS